MAEEAANTGTTARAEVVAVALAVDSTVAAGAASGLRHTEAVEAVWDSWAQASGTSSGT